MTNITNTQSLPISCIEAMKNLPITINGSEIMDEILLEVYNGWQGSVGEERVLKVIEFVSNRIPQYARITNKSDFEFLTIYAKSRKCNYTNWFQDSYLPDLSNVLVFDTVEDFKKKFPSGNYVCPSCNSITTDYQTCNSGVVVGKGKNKKVCDWKVYGLFGDLGKGIKVIVKDLIEDFPRPISMFKPVELNQ